MQRRLAVLLALLATLLLLPSAASAQRQSGHDGPRGGGSSAAGAGAVTYPTPTDSIDDGVYDDDASWGEDGSGGATDGSASDGGATGNGGTAGNGGTSGNGGSGGNGGTTGAGGTGGATGNGAAGPGTTTPPAVDPSVLVPVPSSKKTIRGKVARIRTDGRAAIPRSAPKAVRRVLAAANRIIGKPYKWGGGHARLSDSGYDCSGAVSYALIRAGLQQGSMVSGTFARWAAGGAGRWISIHANAGHVYMEVAGLRLDTSAVGDPAGRSGVRWRPVIGRRTGFHTRHIVGL